MYTCINVEFLGFIQGFLSSQYLTQYIGKMSLFTYKIRIQKMEFFLNRWILSPLGLL